MEGGADSSVPAAGSQPRSRLNGRDDNCISYDPTFAYALAVIIQDGLRRMMQEQEDVYYYLTVMNDRGSTVPQQGRRLRHLAAARGAGLPRRR
ncbi:hypothetical protein E1J61_22725 [Cupriavidus sp. L7L]|nr:hypothetical protein [Cupriavidus sp. L7L]TDF63480.1 hypothetical protein E1J61_22725 [Cupriavidus sp. L7L]